MTGIIWYKTKSKGQIKLEEIIRDYENAHIPIKRYIKGSHALFDNGDFWLLASGTETSKGMRANISYIDYNIDGDFINTVINRSTTALPYQGLMYY